MKALQLQLDTKQVLFIVLSVLGSTVLTLQLDTKQVLFIVQAMFQDIER